MKKKSDMLCNLLILLVRPARIELATFGFVVLPQYRVNRLQ